MASMNTPKPLHIFKPGRQTALNGATIVFSEADLAATAAAYDPAKHEAPLVVGHPALDDPAYGWVKSLVAQSKTEGSSSDAGLYAEQQQLDPAFAEIVAAGRFKKISAAFYAPDAANNPVPGVFYLKHVGFLGAAAPAVKGLKTVAFSKDEAGVITFSEWQEPTPEPEKDTPVTEAEAAALRAENEASKAANAQLQAQLQAVQTAQRRADCTAFAEAQINAGRLLPADKTGVITFMESLPEAVLEFGEGDSKTSQSPAAWFREFMARQPAQVSFGEADKKDPPEDAGDARAIADKATALVTKASADGVSLSFAEAVQRVVANSTPAQ